MADGQIEALDAGAAGAGDKASDLMIARCEQYKVAPPDASWDGSYHAIEK